MSAKGTNPTSEKIERMTSLRFITHPAKVSAISIFFLQYGACLLLLKHLFEFLYVMAHIAYLFV